MKRAVVGDELRYVYSDNTVRFMQIFAGFPGETGGIKVWYIVRDTPFKVVMSVYVSILTKLVSYSRLGVVVDDGNRWTATYHRYDEQRKCRSVEVCTMHTVACSVICLKLTISQSIMYLLIFACTVLPGTTVHGGPGLFMQHSVFTSRPALQHFLGLRPRSSLSMMRTTSLLTRWQLIPLAALDRLRLRAVTGAISLQGNRLRTDRYKPATVRHKSHF